MFLCIGIVSQKGASDTSVSWEFRVKCRVRVFGSRGLAFRGLGLRGLGFRGLGSGV